MEKQQQKQFEAQGFKPVEVLIRKGEGMWYFVVSPSGQKYIMKKVPAFRGLDDADDSL